MFWFRESSPDWNHQDTLTVINENINNNRQKQTEAKQNQKMWKNNNNRKMNKDFSKTWYIHPH